MCLSSSVFCSPYRFDACNLPKKELDVHLSVIVENKFHVTCFVGRKGNMEDLCEILQLEPFYLALLNNSKQNNNLRRN